MSPTREVLPGCWQIRISIASFICLILVGFGQEPPLANDRLSIELIDDGKIFLTGRLRKPEGEQIAVKLTTHGNQEIEIEEVATSCKCAAVDFTHRKILPGRSTMLTATLHSNSGASRLGGTIEFMARSPIDRGDGTVDEPVTVAFHHRVIRDVSLDPARLDNPSLGGKATTMTLTRFRRRTDPVWEAVEVATEESLRCNLADHSADTPSKYDELVKDIYRFEVVLNGTPEVLPYYQRLRFIADGELVAVGMVALEEKEPN